MDELCELWRILKLLKNSKIETQCWRIVDGNNSLLMTSDENFLSPQIDFIFSIFWLRFISGYIEAIVRNKDWITREDVS